MKLDQTTLLKKIAELKHEMESLRLQEEEVSKEFQVADRNNDTAKKSTLLAKTYELQRAKAKLTTRDIQVRRQCNHTHADGKSALFLDDFFHEPRCDVCGYWLKSLGQMAQMPVAPQAPPHRKRTKKSGT